MRQWAGALIAAVAGALLSVAQAQSGAATEELLVTGVAFQEGYGEAASAALAELVVGALRARNVSARAVAPPAACLPPHPPDEAGCVRAVLRLLTGGALQAAVLPVAGNSLPAAPRLREAGVEVWGSLEAADGARRGCWATGGSLRSLAELADEAPAEEYRLAPEDEAAIASEPRYFCGDGDDDGPQAEPCSGRLATALVGPDEEARALLRACEAQGLRLQALALGPTWQPATALARLRERKAVGLVCGRALPLEGAARPLGPPPCPVASCAFDARPLTKIADSRSLARSPAASRAIDRLTLPPGGARRLARRAMALGPEAAAAEALAEGRGGGGKEEARVAVLVPLSTRREVADGVALRVAAEMAERDEAERAGEGGVRFKVEVLDSGCDASRGFRYLTSALGAEFHALAALAGPACAGAFAAVAKQSASLTLPVLAYTPQPPTELALLLAGSASAAAPALAALLAALSWRRAALLTEAGGRGSLDAARLDVELVVHSELPEGEELAEDLLDQWARRAAEREARVLLLVVEDARAARAAMCACARHGLTPERGAAFILGAALPEGWLSAKAQPECALDDQAEGHLRLQWEWAARWEAEADEGWTRRWRALASAPDASPPSSAALLYDALRLWARSLARLLSDHPEAIDDLHRADRVEWLIRNATRTPYSGLTGAIEWSGRARSGAMVAQQWRDGSYARVGRWEAGSLALRAGSLRWRTPNGVAPDDGAEGCARRPLAPECRAATAGVLALTLAALLAVLAGGAWHCRRRAASEHRARLAAFGMRALGPKCGGLDRWELPRERVVINRRLGAGAFGAVYGGHALLGGGRGWAAVAVKTLKAGATTEEKLDFLSEAEAMKRFSHSCVVRLLGVVTRTEPVCTVMEYMLHGDLKGFLLARRHLAGAGEVAPAQLTRMAGDAARGLAYLAKLHYVHRDVAARNCLVGATLRVKLADFGMTRVVFENDYYRFGRKGMLPVRWMAPESLAQGVFSSASDVWSFGVLLYEIITFGALPYLGLPNAEVLERAKAGGAPPLPPDLDPPLEALIRSCWRRERRARPTAAALADLLAEKPRLLTPSLAAPDALDDPLPSRAAPRPDEGRWTWTAPPSAGSGTDCTYLSAPPTPPLPQDSDPFLPTPH